MPPGGSGPNLIRLTSPSLNTVQPGATNDNDFVVAVDNFGTGAALPTGTALSGSAPDYDTAYSQMTAYWNGRLAATPTFSLPNLTLPNTGNLANPGTALTNAYKAGTIYDLMMQVGKAQFSAANNYAWLLNHDVPGELQREVRDRRLPRRAEPAAHRPHLGDARASTRSAPTGTTTGSGRRWAPGLTTCAKTNDTAFVSQYFHDDASGPSPWGPSLYTIMHTHLPGRSCPPTERWRPATTTTPTGRWLFDDYSALEALAAYKYIATTIGQTSEAEWADTAYTSLLNAREHAGRPERVGERVQLPAVHAQPAELGQPVQTPTTTPTGPRPAGSARTSGRRC